GFWHLSGCRDDNPGRTDDLVWRWRALSFGWAKAKTGRHPPLRRLTRPADRPRMVLENLLLRVRQSCDGNTRGATRLPRLYLLHGHSDLRITGNEILLAQP